MMTLIRLIDVVVVVVKILGGRMRVNPVLRLGLWLAVSAGLAFGALLLGFPLVALHRVLVGQDVFPLLPL